MWGIIIFWSRTLRHAVSLLTEADILIHRTNFAARPLIRVRKFPGSNTDQCTDYPTDNTRSFSCSLKEKFEIIFKIRPRPLPHHFQFVAHVIHLTAATCTSGQWAINSYVTSEPDNVHVGQSWAETFVRKGWGGDEIRTRFESWQLNERSHSLSCVKEEASCSVDYGSGWGVSCFSQITRNRRRLDLRSSLMLRSINW